MDARLDIEASVFGELRIEDERRSLRWTPESNENE